MTGQVPVCHVVDGFLWLRWVPDASLTSSGEPPSLVVYYYPDASCGPKALGCAPVIVHFKRHNPKLTWSKGVWCGAPLVRPRGPVRGRRKPPPCTASVCFAFVRGLPGSRGDRVPVCFWFRALYI